MKIYHSILVFLFIFIALFVFNPDSVNAVDNNSRSKIYSGNETMKYVPPAPSHPPEIPPVPPPMPMVNGQPPDNIGTEPSKPLEIISFPSWGPYVYEIMIQFRIMQPTLLEASYNSASPATILYMTFAVCFSGMAFPVIKSLEKKKRIRVQKKPWWIEWFEYSIANP